MSMSSSPEPAKMLLSMAKGTADLVKALEMVVDYPSRPEVIISALIRGTQEDQRPGRLGGSVS